MNERPADPVPLELAVLLDGLTGNKVPDGVLIHGLAGHSGEVRARDLFVALPGRRFDGLDFLPAAVARGAAAAVCDAAAAGGVTADVPLIPVAGLAHKVGVIADRFFAHPSAALRVIAVTGTDGKTSVAHFIAEALQLKHGVCGLIGTLGCGRFGELDASAMTTPDAIRMHRTLHALQTQGVGDVVIEASSHGLEQGRLVGVDVDIAVFTNLGRDHLDYHASREDYAAAKEKLFAPGALDYAVINNDDSFGRELAQRCRRHCKTATYALDTAADVTADVTSGRRGLSLTVRAPGATVAISSPLAGRFNASNLLAAFAVLLAQGIAPDEAASLLARVRPVRGRMQRIVAGGRCAVVDYAHTPGALETLLTACRGFTEGRLLCVFGCGGDRDRGKRALMGEIASRLADFIVISDDNPRGEDPARIVEDIKQGVAANAAVEIIHDREQAIRHALSAASPGDCVVIAGKGHETLQLIGDRRLPFDDAAVVRRALEETGS